MMKLIIAVLVLSGCTTTVTQTCTPLPDGGYQCTTTGGSTRA